MVSEPIITFKETIVNRFLGDKRKKAKGGVWEALETSSDEEVVEAKKIEEEKTLDEVIKDY